MKEKIKKIWFWIVLLFCVFMFVVTFIELILFLLFPLSFSEIIANIFWLIISAYGILKFHKKLNMPNLLKKNSIKEKIKRPQNKN